MLSCLSLIDNDFTHCKCGNVHATLALSTWADDNNNCHKMLKNFKILEFCDYIWNHHEKCNEISTNMPGMSLEICEMWRILWNKTILYAWWKWNQWPRAKYEASHFRAKLIWRENKTQEYNVHFVCIYGLKVLHLE